MDGDHSTTLTGRILLAMPGMGDPRFHKAVILICAHDKDGAMGLVINNTLPGIDLKHLLAQLNIPGPRSGPKVSDNKKLEGLPVMSGGPVENARGFILHSSDFNQHDTVRINDQIGVTGTIDALRSVADGKGPERMIFILGYAGWNAGQLDKEIQDNAWLVSDADPSIIFNVQAGEKWDAMIKAMGIDPAMLSGEAGRA
ncbi:MAG TPA: YqgE/AlgH family protein [Micavibrio sp.]|jgi:putative transcriptional regulator